MLARRANRQKPCPARCFQNAERGLYRIENLKCLVAIRVLRVCQTQPLALPLRLEARRHRPPSESPGSR